MLNDKKKTYNIVLEKKVKETIHEMANEEDRSDSGYINKVLKEHLKSIGKWEGD